jgi:hypothetical protein
MAGFEGQEHRSGRTPNGVGPRYIPALRGGVLVPSRTMVECDDTFATIVAGKLGEFTRRGGQTSSKGSVSDSRSFRILEIGVKSVIILQVVFRQGLDSIKYYLQSAMNLLPR